MNKTEQANHIYPRIGESIFIVFSVLAKEVGEEQLEQYFDTKKIPLLAVFLFCFKSPLKISKGTIRRKIRV